MSSRRCRYDPTPPHKVLGKPGTLVQLANVKDATEVVIVRPFPNAAALGLQLQGADQRSKSADRFIEPTSIGIYGTPSDFAPEITKTIAGSGIAVSVNPQFLGGFIRPKFG